MDIVLVIAGLGLLLAAGDLLVRGAVALSLKLGIPVLIVGLTVVAFGTSAPELLISIDAALSGVPDIAIGNVVGSNIANVLMVLGVPAVISTIHAMGNGSQRSFLQMLGASVLLIILAAFGPLHYWQAAVLLAVFGLIMTDMFREARASPSTVVEEVEELGSQVSGGRMWLYLIAGVIGLPARGASPDRGRYRHLARPRHLRGGDRADDGGGRHVPAGAFHHRLGRPARAG